MPNLWHDYLLALSFVACVAGLWLLFEPKKVLATEPEQTERILFKMSFTYWLVYCIAVGIQKLTLPDWDILLINLKLTAIFSYFLTFSCILCLPLHQIASRQTV